MNDQKPKIAVLIYTYNRTDDARINMEIIRNEWKKSPLLSDIKMVHSYNGKKEWWPEKYLEDEILCLENPGHFAGAELLLNEGMKFIAQKYADMDYVIVLAPDTWCVKPEYVESLIKSMKDDTKYLATCAWGSKEKTDMFKIGMGLDFFIVDIKWAMKAQLFPIRFTEFNDKYQEVFMYQDTVIFLERVFAMRFKQAIARSVTLPSEQLLKAVSKEHVLEMSEREPVHGKKGRLMYWKKIGLITYHDPTEKQAVLKKWELTLGKYGEAFLSATDLSYFNAGLVKNQYDKDGKKVDYKD